MFLGLRSIPLTKFGAYSRRALCDVEKQIKIASDIYAGHYDKYCGKNHPALNNDRVLELLRRYSRGSFKKPKFKYCSSPEMPTYCLIDPNSLHKLDELAKKAMEKYELPIYFYSPRQPIPQEDLMIHENLVGYDDCKFVITDISLSKNYKDRAVVVRETDGSLHHADWEIRDRIEHIYFGTREQRYPYPEFLTNNLSYMLKKKKINYVLKYIIFGLKPDYPLFSEVVEKCCQHVLTTNEFDVYDSTPFFPYLVFYCIIQKQYRELVGYLWNEKRLDMLTDLAHLHYLVHNQNFDEPQTPTDTEFVQKFLKEIPAIESSKVN